VATLSSGGSIKLLLPKRDTVFYTTPYVLVHYNEPDEKRVLREKPQALRKFRTILCFLSRFEDGFSWRKTEGPGYGVLQPQKIRVSGLLAPAAVARRTGVDRPSDRARWSLWFLHTDDHGD
jgi:hypothetical protein